MLKRFDVIVSGGGMVGAAMALSLARNHHSVCVLEASAAPSRLSSDAPRSARVVAINHASQALLQTLGAWPALARDRVMPYQQMQVWDAAGFGQIAFTAAETGVSELGHIVENAVLEYSLYEQCMQRENITWMADTPLTNFAADEESVVVTLEGGAILTANLMVGADGARSRVRELADITWQQSAYQQQGVVAVVTTDSPREACAYQAFSDRGVLAFLPLTDNEYAIVWSVADAEAERLLALSENAFCQAATAAIDTRAGRIVAVTGRQAFPLNGARAERYISERVVLMGDAAHQVHPLAGQGVNLGFADVTEFARLIDASSRNVGSPSLLRRYERARAGENQAMRRLMEGFQFLFLNRNPLLQLVRGVGLNTVDRASLVKQEMLRYALG